MRPKRFSTQSRDLTLFKKWRVHSIYKIVGNRLAKRRRRAPPPFPLESPTVEALEPTPSRATSKFFQNNYLLQPKGAWTSINVLPINKFVPCENFMKKRLSILLIIIVSLTHTIQSSAGLSLTETTTDEAIWAFTQSNKYFEATINILSVAAIAYVATESYKIYVQRKNGRWYIEKGLLFAAIRELRQRNLSDNHFFKTFVELRSSPLEFHRGFGGSLALNALISAYRDEILLPTP